MNIIFRQPLFILIALNLLCLCSLAEANTEITPQTIMNQSGPATVMIATVKNDAKSIGLGSGFLTSSDGVLVTNYHVIKDADPVLVQLTNGDTYRDILVVHVDITNDFVILKINGLNLPYVKIGDSGSTIIGSKIVVIGNPEGLQNTISDGLLSGKRNSSNKDLFQISSPISAGSSGSPVFDEKGDVIGIASSSMVNGQNLNFAIPIDLVKPYLNKSPIMHLKDLKQSLSQNKGKSQRANRIVIDKEKFIEVVKDQVLANQTITDMSFYGNYLGNVSIYRQHKFIPAPHLYGLRDVNSAELNKVMNLTSEDPLINKRLNEILSFRKDMDEGLGALIAYDEYVMTHKNNDERELLDKGYRLLQKSANAYRTLVNEVVESENKLFKKYENEIPFFKELFSVSKSRRGRVLRYRSKSDTYLGINLYASRMSPTVLNPTLESPAEKSGLKRDDVILGLENGKNFEGRIDYYEAMYDKSPGDVIRLRVQRGGMEHVIPIELQSKSQYNQKMSEFMEVNGKLAKY